MTTHTDEAYKGLTVVGSDGSKIGEIGDVYYDDLTGQPEWVSVKTGMFGSKEALVPLADAIPDGENLNVPYDKDKVKDAPHRDADGELSTADVVDLYTHYEIPFTQDGDGPTTDSTMTRSEEQLQVGTRSVETGNVRLRKRVVTENVTQTVPVSHEEVVVERESITAATVGDAFADPELHDEETELTLHADELVVAKQTVPVERVRLGTETVTDTEQVTEPVSHEEINTETDAQR